MMISQKEIISIAENKKLKTSTIDKDWVLGHLLNAFYSIDEVRANFIFKGGTALKKCYFQDYRFSEDLDFTLLDQHFNIDDRFLKVILKRASENSGILFHLANIKIQQSDDIIQGYEVKIKYWGADHKPNQQPLPTNRWQTNIKLDICHTEKLMSIPANKAILHEYSDFDIIKNTVPVYSIEEIMSEKIRSLHQRNRPRDIYDIAYLSKTIEVESHRNIKELLINKCKDKNFEITDIKDFINENKMKINKRAWQSSLGDQVAIGQLQDFDTTYNKISLFIQSILNA